MKQGLVRLLYNLGKVHGVDITHDNVCSSMLSCFYSHLLVSTGRPISSYIYSPKLPLPNHTVITVEQDSAIEPNKFIKYCRYKVTLN